MSFAMSNPGIRRTKSIPKQATGFPAHSLLRNHQPTHNQSLAVSSALQNKKEETEIKGDTGPQGEKGDHPKFINYGFATSCSVDENSSSDQYLVGAVLENFELVESLQLITHGIGKIEISSLNTENTNKISIVSDNESVVTIPRDIFEPVLSGGVEPLIIKCHPIEGIFTIFLVRVVLK